MHGAKDRGMFLFFLLVFLSSTNNYLQTTAPPLPLLLPSITSIHNSTLLPLLPPVQHFNQKAPREWFFYYYYDGWAATTKKGPNDPSSIVWGLLRTYFFLFYVFFFFIDMFLVIGLAGDDQNGPKRHQMRRLETLSMCFSQGWNGDMKGP